MLQRNRHDLAAAYRLAEFEEVIGELHSVENIEMGLIAVIGKISVLLPEELAENLKGLRGKKIGILRLDGYRVCCIDSGSNVSQRRRQKW